MHWFLVFMAIIFQLIGGWYFYAAAKIRPTKTSWSGIPDGKYTTEQQFANNRIVVKDVYGKEVIVFKRDY